MPELWIQLENRPWDTMPHNLDRMTGQSAQDITGKAPENVVIISPGTGVTKTRKMFAPLRDSSGKVMDALIFRRYKAPTLPDKSDAWTIPDDRKVNAWDRNEVDPTDNGTMGTIPGPVIECNVGENVILHFRNLDMRATKSLKARAHSIHPHGFVFQPTSDGAYPLTPADASQPILASERTAWDNVGVTGPNKMGDRVPVMGTFDYHFETFNWPTTAGVWLYHDHSICDMDNVNLGAIGMVVIHNNSDTDNDFVVTAADLPDGNVNGSPVRFQCTPFTDRIAVNPALLNHLGKVDKAVHDLIPHTHHHEDEAPQPSPKTPALEVLPTQVFSPDLTRIIQQGEVLMHLNVDLTAIIGLCNLRYKTPPTKAQFLQLFHSLDGAPGQCINGRTYLGNTPSVVAGINTKMRFGVVGMGSEFHTFHIHGHRWILPGPSGATPNTIQNSSQNHPVSQFEDTRTFGPANSFVFTIEEAAGSFMRAGGPSPKLSKGEWHMHCHVLQHMMMGMMGSLLIVEGGDMAGFLPVGEVCDNQVVAPDNTIVVKNTAFTPNNLLVPSGATITFDFQEAFHTVTTVSKTGTMNAIEINNGGGPGDAIPNGTTRTVVVSGGMGDKVNFMCGIHGSGMSGAITISM